MTIEEHHMFSYITFPGGKSKVLTLSYDDGRRWDRLFPNI